MEKIKELFIKYKEIISYLFFGVATTLINWMTYAIMVRVLSVDLSGVAATDNVFNSILHGETGSNITRLFIANVIAWVAGVIFAFVTNKLWVFESKSWAPKIALKELWGFFTARFATGLLEWFGIPALVVAGINMPFLGIEGFWAKAIVSVAVVILNYVFSKLIIFRKKKKTEDK